MKYIFVTGGVVSSLGKGLASASLGLLLEKHGLKIACQKLDPYINVDPGTMNPFQHGEVYVTDDGAETDLDLGHYERFTHSRISRTSNSTTGQIYETVIKKERQGEYLGQTIQVIPHITDEIKRRIHRLGQEKGIDLVITEIGGTVGDIEGLPFLEAIRQFRLEVGRENVVNVHVTLVPYVRAAGEIKTKPTQHSVQKLREIGIQPDILLCRSEGPIPEDARAKIALFCNLRSDEVIEAVDVGTIYEVPLIFHRGGLDNLVITKLGLTPPGANDPDLEKWQTFVDKIKNPAHHVEIAVVGKYVEHQDAYKSINEAFTHAGVANDARVKLRWIDAEKLENSDPGNFLSDVDGLLVPGGFGERGTEGKMLAVRYMREHKIPFFGICLGLQMAVVEFARNVCHLTGANSSEMDEEATDVVIDIMAEQKQIAGMGGTMRLGAYPCLIKPHTNSYNAYRKTRITERHRHRYEFNNGYKDLMESQGIVFAGTCPTNQLVEIIELKDHPWFVAVQFHPEFKSRPNEPHPLFRDFVAAALSYHQSRGEAAAEKSENPTLAEPVSA